MSSSTARPDAPPRRQLRLFWGALSHQRQLTLVGILFILPALAYFTMFAFIPMLNALRLSLTNYDLLSEPVYVGLRNYERLLNNQTFRNSIGVTIVYAFGVSVPIWVLSMGLAMLLNQNIRFRAFFRTVFFAPIVMPLVVLAVIWTLFYHPNGPINAVFVEPFTGEMLPWLNSNRYALLAVMIMAIWRAVGYYGVIFLAGLQNIPTEYYEAARLDGGSAGQIFWFITWPLLRPTTLFVVVVSIINALRHFDAIWIMTGGGPGDATRVLSVLIYDTGLNQFDMGRASAMSVFLFLFALGFTIVQLRLFRSEQ